MRSMNLLKVALAALALGGCGPTLITLSGSPIDPSAQGWVKVSAGQNNNTRLQIQVKFLAKPDRLVPGTSTFMVWAQPLQADAPPTSLGALLVDRNEQGQLDTLTPLRNFNLTITPEPANSSQAPSNPPVLTAQISR